MASTRTERSPEKPLRQSDENLEQPVISDVDSQLIEHFIVELRPPTSTGFSGTAKLHSVINADLIRELEKRGYTKVDRG